jgi:predicted DNA-binding transcriptional regulator AlpA
MEGFYTVDEVATKLRISRQTVRRWEAKDFPRRVRLSNHPRGRCGFPETEVDAWIEARKRLRSADPPPIPHYE